VFDHRGDAPADAAPEAPADVIIGNTDPVRPRVVKWPAQPPETP
jgi:hypothetical protein